MERRTIDVAGVALPVVGLGTWRTFDVRGRREVENCRRIVDAALDAGAALVDSSPMYGAAEQVLGQALEGRRAQALVATKVWARTPAEGRAQIERALALFGGRVDLYQIHNLVAWEAHLPVLERLRDEGVVTVVGATHYSHAAFDELLRVMRSGRLGQIQVPYNVLDRAVEERILPAASELGLGVVVMQPLGTGALVRRRPPPDKLAPLGHFNVSTWAQALIKWILSDRRIHSTIPATSKVERMRENAVAGDPPWFDDETRLYVRRLAEAMY